MGLRGPGARTPGALSRKNNWTPPPRREGESRAEAVIRFIESLHVTSGVLAGESFRLSDFQKPIIASWYATNDKGRRQVRTGLLTVARKNGKTGLCAALAMAHLCGPEQERRGQIIVGATDSDQSGIIFDELVAFIEDQPELASQCNIKRHEKTIEHLLSGSKFRAMSSDAKKAHGLSPSVVILDELAQWGSGKGRELYDALTTAQGARKDPLVIVIGTQSPYDSSLMSELVDYAKSVRAGEIKDPAFSGFIYEIDPELDVFDEAYWPLANPALGEFREIEDMRDLAQRAKRLPTLESTFRNLFCNQRVQTESALISKAEWKKCLRAGAIPLGSEIYLGLDLSATTDLTALVACSALDDRLKAWFWKPGDSVDEHTRRDRAPYDDWVRQGWIEAPKGKAINYGFVAKRVAEISSEYTIMGIAYDRWHIKNFMRELDQIGVESYIDDGKNTPKIGALRLVPWGQGYADMAPAVDAFEIAILEGRLKHDGNPVLTLCVANARVDMDPAGNRKLDKTGTRFRIDGAQAAAMAIGLKYRQTVKPQPKYQVMFI